jgi:hypothetical protein
MFARTVELSALRVSRQNHESTNFDLEIDKVTLVKKDPSHLWSLESHLVELDSLFLKGVTGTVEKTGHSENQINLVVDSLSLSVVTSLLLN